MVAAQSNLKPKDFASDQEVRWCPGCGDYAVLKAVQKTLAGLGVPRQQHVFVSGIGCASRFPYYLSTYGFHTIHGRAPAVATGVKLANPDLHVWVITGDGDGLSIGGNHLLHSLRRNVDLNILLFNNETYGLTKGQYSPTSRPGTVSPSTPDGSVDRPVLPCEFALGARGRFVARAVDTDQRHLQSVLERAHDHHGASFIEIFQNCIVYNDRVFAEFTDKPRAAETQLHLEHGEPMRYGRDGEKGLRFNLQSLALEVIEPGRDSATDADVLVHDERNRTLAHLLAGLMPPEFPMPMGVLYYEPDVMAYERRVHDAIERAGDGRGPGGDLDDLLREGATWTVE